MFDLNSGLSSLSVTSQSSSKVGDWQPVCIVSITVTVYFLCPFKRSQKELKFIYILYEGLYKLRFAVLVVKQKLLSGAIALLCNRS